MGLGACTYGPRTTLAVALAGSDGVAEFLLAPGDGADGGGARWLLANRYTSLGGGALFPSCGIRTLASQPAVERHIFHCILLLCLHAVL